jgi:glycosyltransferase involved in cell wall biosynthesis
MLLKIVQATEYFLPDIEREIERFVYQLSRGLLSTGQDVTVLTGGHRKSRTLGGIKIEYASMYGSHVSRWTGNPRGQRLAYVPSGILKMYRQGPDIVHAHNFGSGYAAALLKKYDDTPYVLTVHLAPGAPASANPLYRPMYKKALDNASDVISVSHYIRDRVRQDFGVDSTVIPLSVDTEKFKPVADRSALRRGLGLPDVPLVFMVSNMDDRRKRSDLLIRTMPLVLKSVKDARLLLAGNAGPETIAALNGMAERLGVKDSIMITGRLNEMAVRSYLAASDLFVLPSREEAGGMVVLEAMASGVPVIGSDRGGITEYINEGRNGFLFDSDSIEDLADKVISLLKDEAMARSIGHNGRRLAASKYTWGSAISRYMALYRDTVKA